MVRRANKTITENKEKDTSVFWGNITRGLNEGLIEISEDQSKITYYAANDYTVSFKNPEELVRAASFVELVLDYEYSPKRILFEVKVPRRTPEDRADLVIYEDKELSKPFIVVEFKRDAISDSEFKQAIEQVFGNSNSLRSDFAIVIAGITRRAFNIKDYKPNEREKNVISDIPSKYGKAPKYKYVKGSQDEELKIVSREDLIRTLEKVHDTVWQGGKLAPTAAFDEVSKLLFCKLQDEKEPVLTKRGDPYKFQVGTYELPEEVAQRIKNIYQVAKHKDPDVFKEDIKLPANIIFNVVEHLQAINFNKTDIDVKGVAFERFMEDFFRGKMGQFFTPREVIRFAVRMCEPNTKDAILDPACGSGGFLLNTMEYIKEIAEEEYADDLVQADRTWRDFSKDNIYGIEINEQIARVCKMNMILHNDGHSNVISCDALIDFREINKINQKFKKEKFDLIVTNPPFGATVKGKENTYLADYNLGKEKDNQKTEILFIERCIDFLKPGTGRMAIVLPDGILTNSSLQYVRDFILERAQILSVVSIPSFAFSHFGAGVKSSVVFLRKKSKNEQLGNYPIFMAIAEHIGYDASGRSDAVNELDSILKEYEKFKKNPRNYKKS